MVHIWPKIVRARAGSVRVEQPDRCTAATRSTFATGATDIESTSAPPWIFVPRPDPLPSPPDAPVPDLGTVPGPPDKSKSRLKRAIDRAAPRCLDGATHTCWSSPPGEGSSNVSEADREFAKDMEVGDLYFKDKKYKGAELRFRDALDYKPDQPDATFKLAESLNKLGKNDEANERYQAYLKIQPNGPYNERARMALQRLEKKSAGKNLTSKSSGFLPIHAGGSVSPQGFAEGRRFR